MFLPFKVQFNKKNLLSFLSKARLADPFRPILIHPDSLDLLELDRTTPLIKTQHTLGAEPRPLEIFRGARDRDARKGRFLGASLAISREA